MTAGLSTSGDVSSAEGVAADELEQVDAPCIRDPLPAPVNIWVEPGPSCALDTFDGRHSLDERGAAIAGRPHPDAVFDCLYWSNHGPYSPGGVGPAACGWRFVYACEHYPDRCPDAIGDMAACRVIEEPHPTIPHGDPWFRVENLDPDRHPKECPDCGGAVIRLPRCDAVEPAPRGGSAS